MCLLQSWAQIVRTLAKLKNVKNAVCWFWHLPYPLTYFLKVNDLNREPILVNAHTSVQQCCNATIQPTSGACNLGVFFDGHLDLKQHIIKCMWIMFLSAEATVHHATITATRRAADSSACVRVMPPGPLQLANGRTVVVTYSICSQSRTLLHISLAACPNEAAWSQYFETTNIGCQSSSELTSTSVSCHSRQWMDSHHYISRCLLRLRLIQHCVKTDQQIEETSSSRMWRTWATAVDVLL